MSSSSGFDSPGFSRIRTHRLLSVADDLRWGSWCDVVLNARPLNAWPLPLKRMPPAQGRYLCALRASSQEKATLGRRVGSCENPSDGLYVYIYLSVLFVTCAVRFSCRNAASTVPHVDASPLVHSFIHSLYHRTVFRTTARVWASRPFIGFD